MAFGAAGRRKSGRTCDRPGRLQPTDCRSGQPHVQHPRDRLEIFRYSDGVDTFLPSSLSDPGFVTASYDVPSSGSAGDPFGEFAIVLPVPEPSGAGVASLAGLLVIAAALRRARRYPPSVGRP
jgi:hypothetical protein